MVFSNLVFLFIFLPFVLFCYFIVKNEWRNFILLLASLFFYAWGEPKYVFLMLFSILINFIAGLLIGKYKRNISLKKLFLTLGIIGNLLILGFFKYANFLINNINSLLNTSIEMESIPLPIGISFFTFQAMSYVIDVYREDVKVQRSIISLSLYISLFPQLVAGPIVRYNSIAGQLKKRFVNLEKFTEGVKRFIIGLAKKVILANSFGDVADAAFNTPADSLSVSAAWIGIVAYGLQIYFDFSGYSDMAIGLGKMFGFDFLENFNYPYIAKSVSEFWRRWHISLSSWFRDYVYIPLGGNRKGYYRTLINLLIVWTITGFWHGASWTFMAWGLYFGIFIVLERIGLTRLLNKLWKPIQHFYLLFIVFIGWVFFRADNFSYSFNYLKTMFLLNDTNLVDEYTLIYSHDYWLIFLIGIIFAMPVVRWLNAIIAVNNLEKRLMPIFSVTVPFVYMALMVISVLLLVNSTYNPFIYFRF
ncbi:membrane-bound O-acyltransferase family protein [Virgibacillus profundi]|uniref:Membrane-bound O-acyltransferase family protein n=1 Tax=Virgibacillus profundi TaxID=2024555 RepID=A0A2A2IJL5_9BACI|nr:MBOAT family O-acyltransferase [Virgibacillus profundi]PAV31295.1 membrane-bound O-acyltransferase family protein [Virgibacillus profundi]PXY55480.1 MBOAT family protein [Virgibacillus profundi]